MEFTYKFDNLIFKELEKKMVNKECLNFLFKIFVITNLNVKNNIITVKFKEINLPYTEQ